MFACGRDECRKAVENAKPLTQAEINELFPEPTHFIDGEPIPADYFEKLKLFMQGLDEITEREEYNNYTVDGD